MSVIAVFSNSVQAYCAEPDDDSLLGDIGTPHDVIESMDDEMKEYICENMDENERFESFECKEAIDGNTNLRIFPLVSTYSTNDNDMLFTMYVTNKNISGQNYAKVYASFKWRKSVAVKNDTFAIALNSGWETRFAMAKPELTYKAVKNNGVVVQSTKILPSKIKEKGCAFCIVGNSFLKLPQNGYFSGYTNFYAVRKKKNATKQCFLEYVHDASANANISYSVSIMVGFVSISVGASSNQEKLDIYSKPINFSYSTK